MEEPPGLPTPALGAPTRHRPPPTAHRWSHNQELLSGEGAGTSGRSRAVRNPRGLVPEHQAQFRVRLRRRAKRDLLRARVIIQLHEQHPDRHDLGQHQPLRHSHRHLHRRRGSRRPGGAQACDESGALINPAGLSWPLSEPITAVDRTAVDRTAVDRIAFDGVIFYESCSLGAVVVGNGVRFTADQLTGTSPAPLHNQLRALVRVAAQCFTAHGHPSTLTNIRDPASSLYAQCGRYGQRDAPTPRCALAVLSIRE